MIFEHSIQPKLVFGVLNVRRELLSYRYKNNRIGKLATTAVLCSRRVYQGRRFGEVGGK